MIIRTQIVQEANEMIKTRNPRCENEPSARPRDAEVGRGGYMIFSRV